MKNFFYGKLFSYGKSIRRICFRFRKSGERAMGISHYLENLDFGEGGSQINVSGHVNSSYYDLVHWHPYIEVLVSLCDGNEATVNFNKYPLKQNDIVIVYSGSLHSVRYVTEESFLVIQFPAALLAVMHELGKLLPMLPKYPLIRFDPHNENSLYIHSLVTDIQACSLAEEPFREVHIYTKLLSLFAEIGLFCMQAREQVLIDSSADITAERKNNELMAEACLYIEENCTDALTLDEVTRHLGVSKSHFAHLFKIFTNMTFVDFLTSERVKRSESYFHNPNMRVTDIAFESGFSSISSFNRAFRKIKGYSPTEFRKTMIDRYDS